MVMVKSFLRPGRKAKVEDLVYRNVKRVSTVPAPVPQLPKSAPKGMVFFVEPSANEGPRPNLCDYCKWPQKYELYGIGSIWKCPQCEKFYEMRKNKYERSFGKLWTEMRMDDIEKAKKDGRIAQEGGG